MSDHRQKRTIQSHIPLSQHAIFAIKPNRSAQGNARLVSAVKQEDGHVTTPFVQDGVLPLTLGTTSHLRSIRTPLRQVSRHLRRSALLKHYQRPHLVMCSVSDQVRYPMSTADQQRDHRALLLIPGKSSLLEQFYLLPHLFLLPHPVFRPRHQYPRKVQISSRPSLLLRLHNLDSVRLPDPSRPGCQISGSSLPTPSWRRSFPA